MTEEKFVIFDRDYRAYSNGIATYITDLYNAKIYTPEEIPEFFKKDPALEIISLNSEKGLKLLVKEIEVLQENISEEERRLNEKKKGLERLYSSTPNVETFIKEHNKRYNSLIGITEQEKEEIVQNIIQKKSE